MRVERQRGFRLNNSGLCVRRRFTLHQVGLVLTRGRGGSDRCPPNQAYRHSLLWQKRGARRISRAGSTAGTVFNFSQRLQSRPHSRPTAVKRQGAFSTGSRGTLNRHSHSTRWRVP